MLSGSRMNQQGSEYCFYEQTTNQKSANNENLTIIENQNNDVDLNKGDNSQHLISQNNVFPHSNFSPFLPKSQWRKSETKSTKSSKSSKPHKFWENLKLKTSSPFRSKSSEKYIIAETSSLQLSKNSSNKLHQSAAKLLETTLNATKTTKKSPPKSAPPTTDLKNQRIKLFKSEKMPSRLNIIDLLKKKSSKNKNKIDKNSLQQTQKTSHSSSSSQPIDDDYSDDSDDKNPDEPDDEDKDKTLENLKVECINFVEKEKISRQQKDSDEEEDADHDDHEKMMYQKDRNSSKGYGDENLPRQNTNKTKDGNFLDASSNLGSSDSMFRDSRNNSEESGDNEDKIVYNDGNKTFVLEVQLKDGKDLLIKDRCGTSDPYVKFKLLRKVVYKSCIIDKDLNPVWDECFLISLKTLEDPILVQVYDYDIGPMMDDFMGQAYIQPAMLALSQPVELNLMLEGKKGAKKFSYMGYIRIKCTLRCLDEIEIAETKARLESWTSRSQKNLAVADKTKKSIKKRFKNEPIGTLNVLLIEGNDLIPMDDNGLSDPYVKFQLGQEKFKSKCKVKTLNPRWLETFDFDWWHFNQSELEISVYDHDVGGRDDILGRAKLDIRLYEPNKTQNLRVDLEDGAGYLMLLLTLCPYQQCNAFNQQSFAQESTLIQQIKQLPESQQQKYDSLVKNIDYFSFLDDHDFRKEIFHLNMELSERYGFINSMKDFEDVGKLIVTIYQARDLVAADLGGKSDPYCVIELINSRLQTNTVYKSLNPRWRTTYVLDVTDIHAALELTVYDYDKNKKSEFLGKVLIPLLRVRNNEKKWYMLKDKKLTQVTKGAVQLQLSLHYSPVKAVFRTFNPKEEKLLVPENAFKLGTLKGNTDRVFKLLEGMVDVSNFVNSCFDWKDKFHGTVAFMAFVVIVWNAELYMVPLAVVLLLLKNWVVLYYSGRLNEEEELQVGNFEDKYELIMKYMDIDRKETYSYKKLKEEKKGQSLRERLQSIQDVCLQVQETMDAVACVGERVKNTFLWKVPWLSILAILTMLTISTIIYFIPLRLIVLAWGVLRFTRKLRVGDRIPNNEVLDFLSRVPSDVELVEYRELKEPQ